MNARTLDQGYLQTQLLGRLIDKASDSRPMLVLDVGYGMPETVEYFCSFRCRLHFSGFYESLERPAGEEPLDEEGWYKIFNRAMDYPAGTCFDLCLFWDFFGYLEDPALRGFLRALGPYVGPQTFGHGLIASNTSTILPAREYGLLSREQLTLRPLRYYRPEPVLRGRSRLADLLQGFTVARTVLHQGGLLELTMTGK